MVKRSLLSAGMAAVVSFATGAAHSAPSYCGAASGSPCYGRQDGDILIGLRANGHILGLNPNTGGLYTFSAALEQGSVELGDIAVVPSDPRRVVVVGNIINSGLGFRQLDSCGQPTAEIYGPLPERFDPPLPPIYKSGWFPRGLAFNPLTGTLYSTGLITPLIGGTDYYNVLFTFPQRGGPLTFDLALAPTLVDSTAQGLVAADELGNLYVAHTSAASAGRIAQIPVRGLQVGGAQQVEYSLSGDTFGFKDLKDIVHDGNHHLYVSGGNTDGHGLIWRVDTLTGVVTQWASNRGPSYGYEPYNGFEGLTIDASGNIWAIETYKGTNLRAGVAKISATNGSLLQYFQLPGSYDGAAAATGEPWGIAILGVNLPAVREACSNDCGDGYTSDCLGGCMPASWLGDGLCDAWSDMSMSCWSRGYDAGDCNDCPADQVRDCNGQCGPKAWVGDSVCDAGNFISYFNGQYISYDCSEFRFDEASCRSCGPNEMLDCNGNCSPAWWFGDNVCDSGGYSYYDHYVDYDCVEYDFDRNDCPVGG